MPGRRSAGGVRHGTERFSRGEPWFNSRTDSIRRDGRASLRISAWAHTFVPIAEIPIESYRLGQPIDGRAVFVRARIRSDRALRGKVRLSSQVSGTGPTMEERADDRDPVDAPRWRAHELLYVASPDDRNATHQIFVSIDGPGTAWVDDVRVLRGPRFDGSGWRRWLTMERLHRPATGVEEVRAHLVAAESEDVEVAFDGDVDPLFRAFQGRPQGAVPPDRVQRCLTELLLAGENRPARSFPTAAWRRLSGKKKVSARILYWRETVLGFRQPDYLERLVRHAPDAALVETYGRRVLPHMLEHGRALLGLPESEGDGEALPTYFRAHAFTEMTARLLAGVEAGRWQLTTDERGELRALLDEHRRVYGDEGLAAPFDEMKRGHLASTLERLGSEAVAPCEAAAPPFTD